MTSPSSQETSNLPHSSTSGGFFANLFSRTQRYSPEEWKELLKSHPYVPPGSGDARSPCPLLNTFANHGISIPRNGRNFTKRQLYELLIIMGVKSMLASLVVTSVFVMYRQPAPNSTWRDSFRSASTLSLDSLGIHGLLEHDVSLTRHDAQIAPYDAVSVVPELVQQMATLAQTSHLNAENIVFDDENYFHHRKSRWLTCIKENPYLHYSFIQQFLSAAEAHLLLHLLGRNDQISLDHMNLFLLDERFPDNWHPIDRPLSGLSAIRTIIRYYRRVRQTNPMLAASKGTES
ncbi:Chloroperoxidase [Radiomyces spectabilis]|uniref:Chloroperoxidase n=1 Tax=Radiomyces spectabilis TaxID=64574 RepID=UPI00221EDD06|nr:Chloroperoxidase [Radiomyces spectabilis]KAI8391517.1 Chloroperoxidase [Radiomyces spectabilis]